MSYQKRCDIFSEYPDVLQVRDVQIMLGVSRHQVYKLIESGRIRGIKLARHIRFPRSS